MVGLVVCGVYGRVFGGVEGVLLDVGVVGGMCYCFVEGVDFFD